MATVNYRVCCETDFPTLAEKFSILNAVYSQLGYLLPTPANAGEAWVDSFRRTLGRFSNLFVAEVDDKIVGFALCRLKHLPAYMGGVMVGGLSDIWVDREARRLGIADHLTRLVLDWLHAQNAHSVEVQVLKDNEPAWELFQQLGFQYEFRSARFFWDEAGKTPAASEDHA